MWPLIEQPGDRFHPARVSMVTGTLTRWLWMCSRCSILQPNRWSGSLFTSCWPMKSKNTARTKFHDFLDTKHQVCAHLLRQLTSMWLIEGLSWEHDGNLELNQWFAELLRPFKLCFLFLCMTCMCVPVPPPPPPPPPPPEPESAAPEPHRRSSSMRVTGTTYRSSVRGRSSDDLVIGTHLGMGTDIQYLCIRNKTNTETT